jgi:hypothetical protein
MTKTNFKYCGSIQNMSEEEEHFGVDTYENEDDADEESSTLGESIEESAQPVEIVREEIVMIAQNPNAETYSEGSTEDYDREDDLYKLVKAHSAQLSRLTDIVESLQSRIKQLEVTRFSGRKTSSARRRSSTMKIKKNRATSKKTKGKSSKKKK